MPRQLATIRTQHFIVDDGRGHAEHLISHRERHAPRRCDPRTRSGLRTSLTQHGLETGELHTTDAEHGRDAPEQCARLTAQIAAIYRRAHLNFEEHAQQIRSPRTRASQTHHGARPVVTRIFTVAKEVDGGIDLRRRQSEIGHHASCRLNFCLRNATVSFGNVTHHFEGRTEKFGGDCIGIGDTCIVGRVVIRLSVFDRTQSAAPCETRCRTFLDLFVEQMTTDETEHRAGRTANQHAECATGEFPAPLHAAILPTPVARPDNSGARTTVTDVPTVHTTALRHLRRLHTGKVRDIYEIDATHMLIVTTDRLSAFDVVLPDPIPHKGRVLTEISNFWFARTTHIVPNQSSSLGLDALPLDADERALLAGRAMVVKRLQALPLEAVVRGYLIGSGWKDYQQSGEVCGIRLPTGLRQAERLSEPLFTPASKAPVGEHDENISYAIAERTVGVELAARVRDTALALYRYAAAHALARGIIIADTKFEFGLDADGTLTLMDEVLTPDSSRYWPADTWREGANPPSFDKQYLRDWLETAQVAGKLWDKTAPAPRLPQAVIEQTAARYLEACQRIGC